MQDYQFIRKFFFSSFSKFLSSTGLILFNILIIYLTSKETLGLLTLAISLITFLSIFTKFGLNHATLRLTSIFFENKESDKINQVIIQAIMISGTISLVIASLIIFFEQAIAMQLYENIKLKGVLKIFAISLPFFTFLQVQKSLFKSFKLPELSNVSDIGSILFLTSIMIIFFQIISIDLTIYRISLFFLFSCLILFSFNNFILFYLVLINFKKIQLNRISLLKENFIKTLPDYFSIDFVNFTTVWGSIFICSFYFDSESVGSFSSIYWFAYSVLFFPLVLNSIFAPHYAIDSKNKDVYNQKKQFYKNRNLSILVSIPIIIILFIFSDFFLNLFFSITSEEFILVFRILLFNSLLRIIFGPQVLFLNMSNKQKKLKFILIICALLQICLIFISVLFFQFVILAITFLISNLIKHVLLYKELQIHFNKL